MSGSVAEVLADLRTTLCAIMDPSAAAREARLIVQHVTGWSGAALSARLRDPMLADGIVQIAALSQRRLARQPLPQILGQWAFYDRMFRVTSDVLCPRPDTETLIELALAAPFQSFVDLGTGSGAIAITLLAERPDARGIASDISSAALAIAQENADQLGVADRLMFVQSDWFTNVEGQFDLIVSNPPYVAAHDYERLAPEVTEWEPCLALTPGGDGLSAYRILATQAPAHLMPGGRLMVEIGWDQGRQVADIFSEAGFIAVQIHSDINNKQRVVEGRKFGPILR
ncbi:MAG: release factor glutamine methyltransferase [Paracoccaceae bacterium]|jgi:release factor glutamine methyltransferase